MFNDSTVMMATSSGGGGTQTIGEAGQQGFGVGVYGGDPADLTAMGLTLMEGGNDPTSDNYGNYIHTNGSVMAFIPAFCYRIGNSAAPNYSSYGVNALEVRDASLGEGDGWILHRAFIDGGEQKLGFFIDKYLCSKDSTGNLAVSVKNGNPINLSSSYVNSSSLPDCQGQLQDIFVLGRARGEQYSAMTAFQCSAIAMLSFAHGEAASSTAACAWYDPTYNINFPKGNNNFCKDINDASVTFTQGTGNYSGCAKTGSASDYAKTSHNGQNSGITDINGNLWNPLPGIRFETKLYVLKESVKAHDMTDSNCGYTWDSSLFDMTSIKGTHSGYWGNASNNWVPNSSGANRAICGVYPESSSDTGANIFGKDYCYSSNSSDVVPLSSGRWDSGSSAGVFYRAGSSYGWSYSGRGYGFRCAGYAS